LYAQAEWGWLMMWLCIERDENEGVTADRASTIAEAMMFSVRSDLAPEILNDWSNAPGAANEEMRARMIGVGFSLIGCTVGVDEPDEDDG
jgi:hypothetical protein